MGGQVHAHCVGLEGRSPSATGRRWNGPFFPPERAHLRSRSASSHGVHATCSHQRRESGRPFAASFRLLLYFRIELYRFDWDEINWVPPV